MNIWPKFRRQLVTLWPTLCNMYLPSLAALWVVAVIGERHGIPFEVFSRDIATTTSAAPYTGLVSHLGILLWTCCVAICWFSVRIVRRGAISNEHRLFLVCSGLLTLLLLCDDLFLLHEVVFKALLSVGEKVIFASYALAITVYLYRFRSIIRASDYLLLVFAIGFFGVSLLVDVFGVQRAGGLLDHYLLEDGAKLLGIISWCAYFGRVSLQLVNKALAVALLLDRRKAARRLPQRI